MDAPFFLSLRLDTIASFYKDGSAPFRLRMEQIDGELAPYDNPPYSEDAEPPYVWEWQQASDAVVLMGAQCVSMLAGTLQIYLDSQVHKHGDLPELKKAPGKSWWNRHQSYFAAHELDFAQSGANLQLLSEVVLARNSVQHQDNLVRDTAVYRPDDLKKLGRPFFINETEAAILGELDDDAPYHMFSLTIDVSKERLDAAIAEVKKLAKWLDTAIWQQRNEDFQRRMREQKSERHD